MSNAKTSIYGRGTVGYRAPEILSTVKSYYSNRSDIWALGCILHQLVIGHRVFEHDFETFVHYNKDPPQEPPLRISYDTTFWQQQASDCLYNFVSKDPRRRAKASQVCQRLLAYAMILDLTDIELLADVSLAPPYIEWGILVKTDLSIFKLLVDLLKWYSERGHHATSHTLMKTILSIVRQKLEIGTFWIENGALLIEVGNILFRVYPNEDPTFIFEGLLQNVPRRAYDALGTAAATGDVFSLRVLLSRGEDVNAKDQDRRTALDRAAANGHLEAVKVLVKEAGADVESKSNRGLTPLSFAAV